jgi:hypothetical protein
MKDCYAVGNRPAAPTVRIGLCNFDCAIDVGFGCLAISGDYIVWPRWIERIADGAVLDYFFAANDERDVDCILVTPLNPSTDD